MAMVRGVVVMRLKVFAVFVGVLALACSDDPQAEVCASAVDALVDNCDANNADDVSRVSDALINSCGIDFSSSDLNSRSALEDGCLEAIAGVEISGAEATAFRAILNAQSNCAGVANSISSACSDF